MNRVFIVRFAGIEGLPATGRKDVFISFVPGAHQHLARVRLVLFNSRVGYHTYVVVNVEVEERAGLAPRLMGKRDVNSQQETGTAMVARRVITTLKLKFR